jgi:hypothetical protein
MIWPRVAYRVARWLGFRRVMLLGLGIVIGMLTAPVPGSEIRAALRRLVEARRAGSDAELAERVRFELAHHPRTWHLPQPEVTVVYHRVALTGQVPDETARQELVRAVAALGGVNEVDDRLAVVGTHARR